jgi:hypothetical protein
VVKNSTPVANVVVSFKDDDPLRKGSTNSGGHYSFITLAPGTSFNLSFTQLDNPQITPNTDIVAFSRINGTLPVAIQIIDLPDLDISLIIDGLKFQLVTPLNGVSFSAAVISPVNPIQFIWTLYNEADSYHVELGRAGSDIVLWNSSETALTNWMRNGLLDDGSHISAGNYWWRVVAKKTLGNYRFTASMQPFDIIFIP